MDYVVGSVAALITGNVTPNRPKISKRALTPMKHQPSPNVTPKSESVTDRSIFLSPTMQKKKAIVKKSPKRIFQNPDMDVTGENVSLTSPTADKVKKHLKNELDADNNTAKSILSPKSPKNKIKSDSSLSKKVKSSTDTTVPEEIQVSNESTPKKKKKKLSLVSESTMENTLNNDECTPYQNTISMVEETTEKSSPKKKRKSNMFTVETIDSTEAQTAQTEKESSVENIDNDSNTKKKKSKKMIKDISEDGNLEIDRTSVNKENLVKQKKNKKRKKKQTKKYVLTDVNQSKDDSIDATEALNDEGVNPNAITNQDTDSEHESDDDIQSENEESNKAVLDTGPQESSDEDEEVEIKGKKEKKNSTEDVKEHVSTEEEVKRTLFVGNVPFSSKCKKEIKKIFSKYGEIETVRIRTVPVKDGRVTPKLAVIKNELHPDRSTVNVYVKFANASSVDDALAENNMVLNERHLRVARSERTGSEHDPRCAVFVGNLPFALEDDALRATFQCCGEIESVRIVRDRKTNAGKGFGYVNFATKDGVELALALTEEDLTIKNRILRVKRCTQLTANQQKRQKGNQVRQNNYGRQNYQGRQQNQGRQFNNHRGPNRDGQGNRFARNQFGSDRTGRFQRKDHSTDGKGEGAYRRIMEKRKPQDSGEGPPQKRQKDLNQSNKEKKERKEFVGITADKKKFQKRKITKEQKKKKALSEILTKQRP